jgi:hydroxypyruvate isomerase
MNRRDFARNVAGAALGAAALRANALGSTDAPRRLPSPAAAGEASGVPFTLSVMLWTVFTRLPFEQRLEKVAEAGYRNVELVGEYRHWSDADFSKVNAKRRELGISFDTTAGLAHGVGDPHERDALLADLKHELPIMEKIECPAVIIMSGNVVPGLPRAQQHQSCIDGLKRAAELVDGKEIAGQKIRLLLENIDPEENPKYYLQSVAEGFEIIAAVNHPQVQFLYDFFHEQISEGNLIEKLEENINEVGLVHIADVPGRHEPGTGEINYENIFKTLGRLKYDRYAAMEFLPTSDPVGKLRAAREMAIQAGRVS